ncbi:MAG: hypothetical protein H6719_24035 [Sandaracinaceae bacterium]|nr:hypothetical protein [Sandaracinaceae bacterium]
MIARIGVALVLAVGCVAPVDPASCVGCAAPLEPADPCAGLDCAGCLDRVDRPEAAALVRSAEGLDALATELEATLAEGCDVMVAQLDLRDAPTGLDACPVVTAEVARRVRDLLPLGVRLSVADEPALCSTALAAAADCLARCDVEALVDEVIECDGELLGACDGVCDGVCHGQCGATCEGTCSDFCDGACDASCVGVCDGACPTVDRDGRCLVFCDGRCDLGACDGTCTGACSGVCTEACAGSCEGTCIGACDGGWEPACGGVVAVRSERCGLACTAAAALTATCPVPEVRVRGPEAEDPRDHGLIDQLVLTASRHYEPLYALEARVRLTLAPWLEAFAAAVEAAASGDPDGCLPDHAVLARAALARIEAVRATSVALIAAAEDSIGEKLD